MSHFHGLVNGDVYGSRILITTPTSLSHVRDTACAARIYGRRVRPTGIYQRIVDCLLAPPTLLLIQERKIFFNEQRNRDDAAKKRANTSGVGESINYYEDIYNIPPYNNTH